MKILTIQDISCYGQCSTTVALPILSSYGHETVILPSAILSTHTGGFKGFTVHDLTDEMPKIINHWKSENIKLDALYTGYIGASSQFDYILDVKNSLLTKNGLFFVDPAMADHGKMYYGLGEDIIKGMRRICSVADYILPNITEACFLTDTPYQEKHDEKFINTLLDRLLALGAKNVILTGYEVGNKIGAIARFNQNTVISLKEKVEPSYHGTGDIFSSVIIGNLLNNKSMQETLDDATQFIVDCINDTKLDKDHSYGVKFEKVLYKAYIK
jgi:pyridoxine kinase